MVCYLQYQCYGEKQKIGNDWCFCHFNIHAMTLDELHFHTSISDTEYKLISDWDISRIHIDDDCYEVENDEKGINTEPMKLAGTW